MTGAAAAAGETGIGLIGHLCYEGRSMSVPAGRGCKVPDRLMTVAATVVAAVVAAVVALGKREWIQMAKY